MEENFHIPIKIDGTCALFFCVVRSEWNYFNDRHSPTHMSIEHHIKQSLKISINTQRYEYESNTHRTKKKIRGIWQKSGMSDEWSKCVEQIALNVLITENNVSELNPVVMATQYIGAAHKITANQ